MRCPVRGGQQHFLHQGALLLIWLPLLLHTTTCQDPSVTSRTERPLASTTTISQTSTTGPERSRWPRDVYLATVSRPVSSVVLNTVSIGNHGDGGTVTPQAVVTEGADIGSWTDQDTTTQVWDQTVSKRVDVESLESSVTSALVSPLAVPFPSVSSSLVHLPSVSSSYIQFPSVSSSSVPLSLVSTSTVPFPPVSPSTVTFSSVLPSTVLSSSSSSSVSSSEKLLLPLLPPAPSLEFNVTSSSGVLTANHSSVIYSSQSHQLLLLPSSDFTATPGVQTSRVSLTPSLDTVLPMVLTAISTSLLNTDERPTKTYLADDKDIMSMSMVTTARVAPDVVEPLSLSQNLPYLSVIHLNMNVTESDREGVTLTDLVTPVRDWNQTSTIPPNDDDDVGLSVGAIVGITVACVLVVLSGVLVGLALMYHRHRSRKLDTTKAQSNHYTGLWDDNVTLSYINNHFDFFQKDAQDEMISLDNDAYLNSLEFMVFTNTWGDGKRNTRF